MAKKSKKSDVPNKGGRPPIHATPEAFESAANAYFLACEVNHEAPTVTGLALAVGFSSIQSLNDTARRPGFSEPVKTAKLRVENSYEKDLRSGIAPAGPIFALKNFGWRDKQEVDVDLKVTPAALFASAKKKEGAHGGDA